MQNQEASWLLCEKYHGHDCPAYHEDLARLAAGEPLAYVIGYVPFLGCKIWLDSRPLIPRPETEYWVEKAIITIKQSVTPRGTLGNSLGFPSEQLTTEPLIDEHLHILDLCAGSGAIGVAVANHIPQSNVTFAEIDHIHLPTIKKNIDHTRSQNSSVNWTITQSDLFENITSTFDFILTNPPYIDPALDRTELSVKNYEPPLALYGGDGGLALIKKIIAQAPIHLQPQGQLWIEHEPEQAEALAALGTTAGFAVTTHPDQYGVLRYSVLVLE
jgi:release factor glutamine methyltransferase